MNEKKIRILPPHVANKIAAGEVVQRADSVVKELLENALDAGATNIVVVVEEGGKKLIKVTDDGVGMSEGDALLATQRHATSKIVSIEDLEQISTYGFRGEALPSIASVSQLVIKTKIADEDAATVVHIAGGGEPKVSREARERGTTVSVQNLFYNIPARRKFLKSDNTETRHIMEVVQRLALSHPEVALKCVSNGETSLDLKPASLQQRMLDIFGERQVEGMLPVEQIGDVVSASGYLGKPTFASKGRASQYLFLNRRYIVSRNLNHAVFSAYEHLMLRNAYPFFLLFLDIDPHRVDVNVHPAKLEAKFEDEQAIYRFIHTLVRKFLSAAGFVPMVSLSGQANAGEIGMRFTGSQHLWPRGGIGPTGEVPSSPGERFFQGRPFVDGKELAGQLLGDDQKAGSVQDLPNPSQEGIPQGPIWQVHSKYILLQLESGLMVIDQHAAHERVLYERTVERLENHRDQSQQLLFPITIQLTPVDSLLLNDLLPHFERIGFSIKNFGGNTFVVEGIPHDIREGDQEKIIQNMLANYRAYEQHVVPEPRDAVAKSFSCRAAVKAGDHLTEQEMRALIEQLFQTKIPYVCPHGRPVAMRISVEELDKRFGRT